MDGGEPTPLLRRVAAAASAADVDGRVKAAASLHRLSALLYEFQLGVDGVPDGGDPIVAELITEARAMR